MTTFSAIFVVACIVGVIYFVKTIFPSKKKQSKQLKHKK
ncbi:hypothetical protein PAMA111031_08470 [Paraphotobacterium marinum]